MVCLHVQLFGESTFLTEDSQFINGRLNPESGDMILKHDLILSVKTLEIMLKWWFSGLNALLTETIAVFSLTHIVLQFLLRGCLYERVCYWIE